MSNLDLEVIDCKLKHLEKTAIENRIMIENLSKSLDALNTYNAELDKRVDNLWIRKRVDPDRLSNILADFKVRLEDLEDRNRESI